MNAMTKFVGKNVKTGCILCVVQDEEAVIGRWTVSTSGQHPVGMESMKTWFHLEQL